MLSDLIKKSILISWKSGVKQSGFNHIKMMLHSVKLVTLKNIVFAVVLEAIYNVQTVIGIKKIRFYVSDVSFTYILHNRWHSK